MPSVARQGAQWMCCKARGRSMPNTLVHLCYFCLTANFGIVKVKWRNLVEAFIKGDQKCSPVSLILLFGLTFSVWNLGLRDASRIPHESDCSTKHGKVNGCDSSRSAPARHGGLDPKSLGQWCRRQCSQHSLRCACFFRLFWGARHVPLELQ